VGVFDAGQIQTYHVKALQDANIKVIINMRQGMDDENGVWSATPQEPINLLNLGFSPATKGISNTGEAEFEAANAALVIDDTRSPSWVCSYPDGIGSEDYVQCEDNTEYNFESKNTLEWGDNVGQNAKTEGEELEAAGIKYFHLPVGPMMSPPVPFNEDTFLKYGPDFIAAVNAAREAGGHVLFHCTIGYRTGAFPTALLGLITEEPAHYTPMLTRTEMNNMMHGWGYDVADELTGHVFEVGTNALFGGLSSLQFGGTTDWSTGELTGSVVARQQSGSEESTLEDSPDTPTAAPHSHDDNENQTSSTAIVGCVFGVLGFLLGAAAFAIATSKGSLTRPNSGRPGIKREDSDSSINALTLSAV